MALHVTKGDFRSRSARERAELGDSVDNDRTGRSDVVSGNHLHDGTSSSMTVKEVSVQ